MADKITEMYAFVILDDGLGKGNEGIPAFEKNGLIHPLVGADMARIESLRPHAQKLVDKGFQVEIRKFTNMEVLEVIGSSKTPICTQNCPIHFHQTGGKHLTNCPVYAYELTVDNLRKTS